MDDSPCPFDCIVVTAANERQAESYTLELEERQKLGVLPKDVLLLSVADPKGARVGSGGGTLNALVRARERLLCQASDGDRQWRILCVHSGGDSQRSPTQSVCGKAWSALNCVAGPSGHLCAPIDLLCFRIFRLCRNLAPGSFVVASCDVLLLLPESNDEVLLPETGVWGLAVAADRRFGPHHGVYVAQAGGGRVEKFLQKPTEQEMIAVGAVLPGDEVLIDSGIVAFDAASTGKLVQLTECAPFDGCVGANEAKPFRFELYSDLMLALGGVLDRVPYMAAPSADKDADRTRVGREALWDAFADTGFEAVLVPGGQFAHLGTTTELLDVQTGKDEQLREVTQHFGLVNSAQSTGALPDAVCVNTVFSAGSGVAGAGAVLEHSSLSGVGCWSAGAGALLSGFRLQVPSLHVASDNAIQQIALSDDSQVASAPTGLRSRATQSLGVAEGAVDDATAAVLLVLGRRDQVKKHFTDSKATICGKPWADVLAALGATPEVIWPPENVNEQERCLWTARLYPAFRPADAAVLPLLLLQEAALGSAIASAEAAWWRESPRLSLKEILATASPAKEFAWRRKLRQEVVRQGAVAACPVVPEGAGGASSASWDVICVTARMPAHAEAYRLEILRRRGSSLLPESTLVLAAGDPNVGIEGTAGIEDQRVGSGGATLNAITLIAEHLSASAGDNTVDMSVLRGKRALVLHVGGADQRIPAFSRLPSRDSAGAGSQSTLDLLLASFASLARSCPTGLFIVSSEDAFIRVQPDLRARFVKSARRVSDKGSVTAMAVAMPGDAVREHGVYTLGDDGAMRRVLYRPTPGALNAATSVASSSDGAALFAKVSGVVFFDTAAAEHLLQLAFDPVFESCSYLGIDNGAWPTGFSLYLDLLACMGCEASADEFGRATHVEGQVTVKAEMRQRLWDQLHGKVDMRVVVADGCQGGYTSIRSARDYQRLMVAMPQARCESIVAAQSFVDACQKAGDGAAPAYAVNSLLRKCSLEVGAIIEGSSMERCTVGAGAICSGLRKVSGLQVPSGLLLQQISLLDTEPEQFVILTLDIQDGLRIRVSEGTFLGMPWDNFFRATSLQPDDLWPHVPESGRSLAAARLFPVVDSAEATSLGSLWLEFAAARKQPPTTRRCMVDLWKRSRVAVWRKARRLSFAEILLAVDIAAEFEWQDSLMAETNLLRGRELLLQVPPAPLRHLIDDEVRRGRWGLLDIFDEVAADPATPPDVAARALAQIAEVLAAFGGEAGGLRSGSARNLQWKGALARLGQPSTQARCQAVHEMRALRQQWVKEGPVSLIRLARHYEAATQVLIRTAVSTAQEFISIPPAPAAALKPAGEWYTVEAPARADLAGGWTDTPPICYEMGGVVTNLAIKIDGARPIGAKSRRLRDRPELVFVALDAKGNPRPAVVCQNLEDLEDYNSPQAPAALLKACVLCCDIIKMGPGAATLKEQLTLQGGGLEVVSWSYLPEGSGLGTSSILAAAIMKAMIAAAGRAIDDASLVHGVLVVEQMLTSGGGWQDQVGGIVAGAKIGRSAPQLPLKVEMEAVPISPALAAEISKRLVLVFTGRPRLAKNLLQNVLRQWFRRLPEICQVLEDLAANAETAAAALKAADLARLGACISKYREHKKCMAPGSEPPNIMAFRERLAPLLLGATLAGAGGGGFMVLLMREHNQQSAVQDALASSPGMEGATVHTAEVDIEGLVLR